MNIMEYYDGPWSTIIYNGDTCEIVSSSGNIIVDDGSCDGEYAKSTPYNKDTRLIATAPEMLDRLIEVAEEEDLEYGCTSEATKRIIEKATGLPIEEVLKNE